MKASELRQDKRKEKDHKMFELRIQAIEFR